jgi:hypothetical protein
MQGLIAYRILKVTKKSSEFTVFGAHSSLYLIQRVIIESGLIYTLTTIVVLVLNFMETAAVYIAADSVRIFTSLLNGRFADRKQYIPIVPICFNLIVVRTSNRKEDYEDESSDPIVPIQFKTHDSVASRRGKPTVHDDTVPMHVLSHSEQGGSGIAITKEKWTDA